MILLVAVCTPVFLHFLLFRKGVKLLIRKGVVRSNYAGQVIPTAGGLFFALYHTVTLLLLTTIAREMRWAEAEVKQLILMVGGSLAMALWGWLDDRSKDQDVKGFRGHLSTLWQEGRMTSGLLKAWAGTATSLLVALPLSTDIGGLLIHAGLLALAANLINLFDLRPTRAIKVFWLILLLVVSGAWQAFDLYLWILPALMSTIVLFLPDGRQQIMLGDTGSNCLGFLAGFLLITTQSMTMKIILLGLMVILHVLAEFISFSRVIQAVGWLRRIDQWGRET